MMAPTPAELTPAVPTHVVLLTAPGRAAVATVLVAGPDATRLVSEIFLPAGNKPLVEQPLGRIVFGRWPSSNAGEEVVVARRTHDRLEIHCHGGRVAAQAIVAALTEQGCQQIDWPTWTRLSTADPLEAEAQIALAEAPTQRVAQILCDQTRGVLRAAFDEIHTAVAENQRDEGLRLIARLLAWAPLGLHLTRPWPVVLAGRPNVGKSSLINALLGYHRAIVHATPGTTRDVVRASAAIDGWPIELADTAGLRSTSEPLESAGIALTNQQATAADLVLLLFDRSQPWSDEDESLLEKWPRALMIFNKCDLPASEAHERAGISISALEGSGLEQLTTAIVERLVPLSPPAGTAVPFLPLHVSVLQAVQTALTSGDQRTALAALQRVAAS